MSTQSMASTLTRNTAHGTRDTAKLFRASRVSDFVLDDSAFLAIREVSADNSPSPHVPNHMPDDLKYEDDDDVIHLHAE